MGNVNYHVPVMLQQCIEGLNINPEGTYVDVTFGGGGHSKEILKYLNKSGKLYGFDQDEDAYNNIPKDIPSSECFTFVRSNFKYMKNFMKYYKVQGVDGILADLGVSSHHFDEAKRGFSFRFPQEKLDMRMNTKSSFDASVLVNEYSAEELMRVFRVYGELKNARRLSFLICNSREKRKIVLVQDLLDAVGPAIPKEREKKELAKLFQALRIEVNKEMSALEEMLKQSLDLLNVGGRLVVMTYHSLEDRIVKNFIKSGNFECKIEKDFYGNVLTPFVMINRKVIVANKEEQESNPRSRSAKLRIAEKK